MLLFQDVYRMFTPGGGGYGKPNQRKGEEVYSGKKEYQTELMSSGSLGQYKMNQEST